MSPTFVLMNHGNQNVVITDVGFILLYSNESNPTNVWSHGTNPPLEDCNDSRKAKGSLGSWERIRIGTVEEEARPIVVEPGKTFPVRTHLRKVNEMVNQTWKIPNSQVTTCFYIRLIDLEGVEHERTIPALTFGSGGGKGGKQSSAIQLLN
jgi:hypothetical protein